MPKQTCLPSGPLRFAYPIEFEHNGDVRGATLPSQDGTAYSKAGTALANEVSCDINTVSGRAHSDGVATGGNVSSPETDSRHHTG
jgi:hypothetical protein